MFWNKEKMKSKLLNTCKHTGGKHVPHLFVTNLKLAHMFHDKFKTFFICSIAEIAIKIFKTNATHSIHYLENVSHDHQPNRLGVF